jgi:hypothetical protein
VFSNKKEALNEQPLKSALSQIEQKIPKAKFIGAVS